MALACLVFPILVVLVPNFDCYEILSKQLTPSSETLANGDKRIIRRTVYYVPKQKSQNIRIDSDSSKSPHTQIERSTKPDWYLNAFQSDENPAIGKKFNFLNFNSGDINNIVKSIKQQQLHKDASKNMSDDQKKRIFKAKWTINPKSAESKIKKIQNDSMNLMNELKSAMVDKNNSTSTKIHINVPFINRPGSKESALNSPEMGTVEINTKEDSIHDDNVSQSSSVTATPSIIIENISKKVPIDVQKVNDSSKPNKTMTQHISIENSKYSRKSDESNEDNYDNDIDSNESDHKKQIRRPIYRPNTKPKNSHENKGQSASPLMYNYVVLKKYFQEINNMEPEERGYKDVQYVQALIDVIERINVVHKFNVMHALELIKILKFILKNYKNIVIPANIQNLIIHFINTASKCSSEDYLLYLLLANEAEKKNNLIERTRPQEVNEGFKQLPNIEPTVPNLLLDQPEEWRDLLLKYKKEKALPWNSPSDIGNKPINSQKEYINQNNPKVQNPLETYYEYKDPDWIGASDNGPSYINPKKLIEDDWWPNHDDHDGGIPGGLYPYAPTAPPGTYPFLPQYPQLKKKKDPTSPWETSQDYPPWLLDENKLLPTNPKISKDKNNPFPKTWPTQPVLDTNIPTATKKPIEPLKVKRPIDKKKIDPIFPWQTDPESTPFSQDDIWFWPTKNPRHDPEDKKKNQKKNLLGHEYDSNEFDFDFPADYNNTDNLGYTESFPNEPWSENDDWLQDQTQNTKPSKKPSRVNPWLPWSMTNEQDPEHQPDYYQEDSHEDSDEHPNYSDFPHYKDKNKKRPGSVKNIPNQDVSWSQPAVNTWVIKPNEIKKMKAKPKHQGEPEPISYSWEIEPSISEEVSIYSKDKKQNTTFIPKIHPWSTDISSEEDLTPSLVKPVKPKKNANKQNIDNHPKGTDEKEPHENVEPSYLIPNHQENVLKPPADQPNDLITTDTDSKGLATNGPVGNGTVIPLRSLPDLIKSRLTNKNPWSLPTNNNKIKNSPSIRYYPWYPNKKLIRLNPNRNNNNNEPEYRPPFWNNPWLPGKDSGIFNSKRDKNNKGPKIDGPYAIISNDVAPNYPDNGLLPMDTQNYPYDNNGLYPINYLEPSMLEYEPDGPYYQDPTAPMLDLFNEDDYIPNHHSLIKPKPQIVNNPISDIYDNSDSDSDETVSAEDDDLNDLHDHTPQLQNKPAQSWIDKKNEILRSKKKKKKDSVEEDSTEYHYENYDENSPLVYLTNPLEYFHPNDQSQIDSLNKQWLLEIKDDANESILRYVTKFLNYYNLDQEKVQYILDQVKDQFLKNRKYCVADTLRAVQKFLKLELMYLADAQKPKFMNYYKYYER